MIEHSADNQIDALDRAGRRLGFTSTMRNHAAAAIVGLHPTDWLALDMLDAIGPCPIGTLGDHLGLSRSAATALVDRLETRELVERQPTDDRRVVAVAPRPGRGPAYDDVDAELRTAMANHARTFTSDELDVVLRFMEGAADVLATTADQMRRRRR